MRKAKFILLLLTMCLGLQACAVSFRSVQLDLLNRMINPPEEVLAEELAWTMLYAGENYTLYPVITQDGSLTSFVNMEGTMAVVFDGTQVTTAIGLIPDAERITITRTDTGLDYSAAERLLFSHLCEDFVSAQVGGNTIWTQSCTDSQGNPYENEVRINSGGQITQLLFMVHEDYPMITLTPNNLNFFNNN